MSRLFATDYGIWPLAKDTFKLSDKMLASQEHKEGLANLLLNYEKIVIPTGNFQVLPVLRLMLGDDVFVELIQSGAIELARFSSWFSYFHKSDNSGGLSFFKIMDGDQSKFNFPGGNISTSYFKGLEEAIDIALRNTVAPKNRVNDTFLKNLLLDKTIPVHQALNEEQFVKETYDDILKSDILSEFFMMKHKGTDLRRLDPNKNLMVQIYNPESPPDPSESLTARSLLRIAFENFTLGMASELNVDHISGRSKTVDVINSKLPRSMSVEASKSATLKIMDFNGIPDVGALFGSGSITARNILELRNLDQSVSFRKWIETAGYDDRSILDSYREALTKTSFLDRLPMKLLRFSATKAISVVAPVSGFVASTIDSFFLKKWLPKKGPVIYMSNIKSFVEDELAKKTPVPKVIARNDPCWCRSGKKFKKCHGA